MLTLNVKNKQILTRSNDLRLYVTNVLMKKKDLNFFKQKTFFYKVL